MSAPEEPLRVLVVDDTALYRRILTDTLEATGLAQVVGTAPQGRAALAELDRIDVDLVLLDVEMPELDGLATLMEIRKRPQPPVVVLISGQTTRSARITMNALENGALDFVRKPDGGDPEASRRELTDKLRPLLRHVRTVRNLRAAQRPSPRATPVPGGPALASVARAVGSGAGAAPRAGGDAAGVVGVGAAAAALATRRPFVAVAIGVSTGGPNALGVLIPQLPADLPVPVFVVQHMPPGFTTSLAEHLGRRSPARCVEAGEGDLVQNGTVYIAPGGRHMVLRRLPAGGVTVGINDQPPVNSCRPSVDVLFRSLAAQLDGPVLSLIMTGMGSDGCEGVRTLRRYGGYCLSQSEKTCVVYGMPLAVDEAGLSDERVALEDLGARVVALTRRSTSFGS